MRNSFIIYKSIVDAIQFLPPEKELEMFHAICAFSFEGIEPEFEDNMLKMCWALVRPLLEKNNKLYENACKGGAPKGNKNAEKQPNSTKKQPNSTKKQPNSTKKQPNSTKKQPTPSNDDDVDVDEDEDENVDEEGEGDDNEHGCNSHTPTLSDIFYFVRKEGLSIDAEKFYNHYTATGWKGVADWEAMARSWNDKEHEFNKSLSKGEIKITQRHRQNRDFTPYYLAVHSYAENKGLSDEETTVIAQKVKDFLIRQDFTYSRQSPTPGAKIEPIDVPKLIAYIHQLEEKGGVA